MYRVTTGLMQIGGGPLITIISNVSIRLFRYYRFVWQQESWPERFCKKRNKKHYDILAIAKNSTYSKCITMLSQFIFWYIFNYYRCLSFQGAQMAMGILEYIYIFACTIGVCCAAGTGIMFPMHITSDGLWHKVLAIVWNCTYPKCITFLSLFIPG